MVSADPDSKKSKNQMKHNGFEAIDNKQLVSAHQTCPELQSSLPTTRLQSLACFSFRSVLPYFVFVVS